LTESHFFHTEKIMKRHILAVLAVATLALASSVMACGPEDHSSSGGSYGAPVAGYYGGFNPTFAQPMVMQPQMQMYAAMQQQMMMHRQMLAMQAAARRARMQPIRIARAQKLREEELARRQRVRAEVIARTEEYRLRKAASSLESGGPILLSSLTR